MKPYLEDITRELNSTQHKMTPQREVILRVLTEHSCEHPSAEEIYGLVKVMAPDIGLATVYRTLDLLVELNIIHKVDFGDGRARYEFTSQKQHRHHHLICLNCGRIIEAKEDLLHQLEETIERDNGFRVVDHSVKFYGYCNECQSK